MASMPPLRDVSNPLASNPLRPLCAIRDLPVIEGVGRETSGGRQLHRALAEYNARRLAPGVPTDAWESDVWRDAAAAVLEGRFLERCRTRIEPTARAVPCHVDGFFSWLETLEELYRREYGPFVAWVAGEESEHSFRWLVRQEAATESHADDVVGLLQVGFSTSVKNVLLRSFGAPKGRRRLLAGDLAATLAVEPAPLDCVCSEALAERNLRIGLAANRRYAHHALGALACTELLADARMMALRDGCRRIARDLPIGEDAPRSSGSDGPVHRELLLPALSEDPSMVRPVAEGALMAFTARAACVARFREELGEGDTC